MKTRQNVNRIKDSFTPERKRFAAKLHIRLFYCMLSEAYQRFVQRCYSAAWW